MYAEIQGGFTAVKAALELVKAGKGMIEQAAMASALYDIQQRLMEAQGAALQAVEEKTELGARVRELEAQLRDREDWKAEAEKFAVVQIAQGVFVMLAQDETSRYEAAVKLCTTCFNRKRKSILQQAHGSIRVFTLTCNECGAQMPFRNYLDWDRKD